MFNRLVNGVTGFVNGFRRSTLGNPTQWVTEFINGSNESGVSVNPNNATTVTAAYRCVELLGGLVASLPVHVYERQGNKNVITNEHPVAVLLRGAANDKTNSFQFTKLTTQNSLLWGNGSAFIKRDNRGNPIALEQINPAGQEWKLGDNGGVFVRATKTIFGKQMDETAQLSDVLNIPNFSRDGIIGISSVQHHASTLGLSMAQQKTAARFFGNGVTFAGYLKRPLGSGELSDVQIARIQKTWSQKYRGMGKSWETPLLEDGMEFVPVTMPYKDAQFLESREFQGTEVCQMYGVPPHKIYNLKNATFSNIEHQTIEFVNDTLIPRVRAWETELNSKMFFASDNGRFYVKFNLQGLLRGDTATRAAFYNTMTRIGVLSINEVRAFEDLERLDTPEADLHLVQGQMTPISDLGNQQMNVL